MRTRLTAVTGPLSPSFQSTALFLDIMESVPISNVNSVPFKNHRAGGGEIVRAYNDLLVDACKAAS